MNSLRDEALPATCKWRRCFVSALFILATPALFATPPKAAAAQDAKKRPVQSDTLPMDVIVTAPDLSLSQDAEHKAEALAMFVTALIDEDNAENDQALEKFQKTLNLDPGYTELAIKVAIELARRGDPTAGINILKDSIKAVPKEQLCYLCLSQIYEKYLKKPDMAIKYASQGLELNPKNPVPYIALYELYIADKQEKNARQILDRAMKLENTMPEYWLELGDFLTRLYVKGDSAIAPEDLKKMNAVFQKALACSDDSPDLIARIADYYTLLKEQKTAIPLYRKAIELEGDSTEPPVNAIRDKLALCLRMDGQLDEAIALLKQMIKQNPLRIESYEKLGEIQEGKADYENALISYQQSLLLDPTQPVNYLRVADMLLKTKQPGKAVDQLAEAHGKFPDMPKITFSLAVAQSQAKRFQDALFTFEEAMHEAETVEPDMLNGAFYFAFGVAAEQSGSIPKAVELMRKSIELDPDNSAEACNYLGYMWVDRGENLEEAVGFIKRALEQDHDNPAFLDSLGWYYFKTGDYEKALVELQKAAANIQPEDAIVDEHLGDTYSKLNNPSQALIYWKKSAKIDPDNKTVSEKIENAKQKVSANPTPK